MGSSIHLEFEFITKSDNETHVVEIKQAVIGGWTGRDRAALEHHIEELEKIGVSRPKTIPTYYRVGARRLTTDDEIQVLGPDSSGEVEFVLLNTRGRLWVGAGSDHTDRKAEAHGISLSKQMCEKPVARTLWPLDEVAPHWDQLMLRSHATIGGERLLYQEGALSGLLPVSQLLEGYGGGEKNPGEQSLAEDTLMFGGTSAAIGGVRPANRFDFELSDPVLGRSIKHAYSVAVLPDRG